MDTYDKDKNPRPFVGRKGNRNKTNRLTVQLMEMAKNQEPLSKLPTMEQMRHDLQVGSMTTLDRALHELETRHIIYRIQGSGIYVSPKLNQKNIYVLCDPTPFLMPGASPFWGMLLGKMHKLALESNDALSIHFTSHRDIEDGPLSSNLLEDIRKGRVHGILGIYLSEKVMNLLDKMDTPVVTHARFSRNRVEFDLDALVREGILELNRQGCKNIGVWMPAAPALASDASAEPEKTKAFAVYQKTMSELGKNADERLFHQAVIPVENFETSVGGPRQQQGYELARKVLQGDAALIPDGIVIGDDLMTSGAFAAMCRAGLRPGIDIKIASHTNKDSVVLAGMNDLITRLEYNPETLVKTMYELLSDLMDGKEPDVRDHLIAPEVLRPLG
jgi:DNA-binding LacI/PurR family transcriptional regulator